MATKTTIKKPDFPTIEIPYNVGDLIYQVYNDGAVDWAKNRVGVDTFEVESVTILQNGKIRVKATTEGEWTYTLEQWKELKNFFIKEEDAGKEITRLLIEILKKEHEQHKQQS